MVLQEDYSRWGLRRAMHMLLMRALEKIIGLNVAVVYSRPLGSSGEATTIAAGYQVRELTESDYGHLPDNPLLYITSEFVDNARSNGGFCMGAFAGDELVAYVWRAFLDAPVTDGVRLRLKPHLRYGYKAMTLIEHRGLHLQSPISLVSDQTCIDRGCKFGASYIATHNYSSRIGDERRGSVQVGWIMWLRKGSLRWCHTTAGAQRFGLELYIEDRPAG